MASKSAKNKKEKKSKRKQKVSLTPWFIGAGVVALIAVPIVLNIIRTSQLPGETFRSQGNAHIEIGTDHPPYNSNPPTSGWHTSGIAGWGSYDYIVPEERLIHNMEDGGVIIWYQFGSEEENNKNIQDLEAVARGYRRVVIAPRENMETAYALTAWTRLQRFETIDEEAMRTFLDAFEGIDHHAGG